MELEKLLPALEEASFALVFGSFGTGRFGPESDVDLAVRFPRPLPQAEFFDLLHRLSEIAGRKVDLVDLGSADPIIAMQVLRHGRPLLVRDRAAFESFRMTTPSRYFDWRLSRRPVEERLWAAGASAS
jgi:predicted nucleotidyltransferase